jgi:hypothetical protein
MTSEILRRNRRIGSATPYIIKQLQGVTEFLAAILVRRGAICRIFTMSAGFTKA